MTFATCRCGHEKRDHAKSLRDAAYGACKVCLCDKYEKDDIPTVPANAPAPSV